VADQAEQAQPGRWHRPLRELISRQAVALEQQGGAVELEPADQHRALVPDQRGFRAFVHQDSAARANPMASSSSGDSCWLALQEEMFLA
jgi:hypothetical protein